MKQILIIPSCALAEKEINDIKANGYIVIISDEPEKFKLLMPSELGANASDVTLSLLHGLAEDNLSDRSLRKFVVELNRRFKLRESESSIVKEVK